MKQHYPLRASKSAIGVTKLVNKTIEDPIAK